MLAPRHHARGPSRRGTSTGLDGLHFHTLCEQDSDALERTLAAFEEKFGDLIPGMKWVNFGGGHHITRPDYDVDDLVRLLRDFARTLERPGLSRARRGGRARHRRARRGVLDMFAQRHADRDPRHLGDRHMPDVLEMPYRAGIVGAGEPGAQPHTYRLGGLTCLAGDVIGDYCFDRPLEIGERLVFLDMAHYTMVKTTTFNGVRLPSIAIWNSKTDALRVVREFGYEDFKGRLS